MYSFLPRALLPAVIFFVGAYGLAVAVDTYAPIEIGVGMPWLEAERQIERTVCMTDFSSLMAGAPINPETGKSDYRAYRRAYLFPDYRCVTIHLRAPYGTSDLSQYHIHSIGVGPRWRGPEGKFEYNYPWSYAETVNLGSYRWPVVIGWMVAAVLSLSVGFRWISVERRNRRARAEVKLQIN